MLFGLIRKTNKEQNTATKTTEPKTSHLIDASHKNVYEGYQIQSSKKVTVILNRLNKFAGEELFSKEEILLASNLIKIHRDIMNIADLSRDESFEYILESGAVKRAIEKLYPDELKASKFTIRECIFSGFLLNQMDIELAIFARKENDLKTIENLFEAVQEIIPEIERENLEKNTIPLVSEKDILTLGAGKNKVKEIFRHMFMLQLDKEFGTRKAALNRLVSEARNYFDLKLDASKIEKLLGKGYNNTFSMKLEHLKKVREIKFNAATVEFFDVYPFREFNETTPAEDIVAEIRSGLYLNLEKHLAELKLNLDDANDRERIKKLFAKDLFSNVLQMEAWVSAHGRDPITSLKKLKSPISKSVVITRKNLRGKPAELHISSGYQGEDHKGAGQTHIRSQRGQSIGEYYNDDSSSENELTKRFFQKEIIPAACTANLLLPSERDPKSPVHALIGKVGNSDRYIAMIIVKFEEDKYRFITTIPWGSLSKARANIRSRMRKIKALIKKDAFSELLNDVNQLLTDGGQEGLSEDELKPVKPTPKKKNKANKPFTPQFTAADLKGVVPPGPIIGTIKIIIAQNIEDPTTIKQIIINKCRTKFSNVELNNIVKVILEFKSK